MFLIAISFIKPSLHKNWTVSHIYLHVFSTLSVGNSLFLLIIHLKDTVIQGILSNKVAIDLCFNFIHDEKTYKDTVKSFSEILSL